MNNESFAFKASSPPASSFKPSAPPSLTYESPSNDSRIGIQYTIVAKNGLKVRTQCDIRSSQVTKLPEGTVVTVTFINGRRSRIIAPVSGWISNVTSSGKIALHAIHMAANNFHFNSPDYKAAPVIHQPSMTSPVAQKIPSQQTFQPQTYPSRSDLQQESQQTNGGALIVAEKLEAELKKLQADFEKLRGESLQQKQELQSYRKQQKQSAKKQKEDLLKQRKDILKQVKNTASLTVRKQQEDIMKQMNSKSEEMLKRVRNAESFTKKQAAEFMQCVTSQSEELLQRVENAESLTKKQRETIMKKQKELEKQVSKQLKKARNQTKKQKEEILKIVDLQNFELSQQVKNAESLTKMQREELLKSVDLQKEEILQRFDEAESMTKKQKEEMMQRFNSEHQEILQRVQNAESQRQEILQRVDKAELLTKKHKAELMQSFSSQKEEILQLVENAESLTKKQQEELLQTFESKNKALLQRVENTENLTKQQAAELMQSVNTQKEELLQHVKNAESKAESLTKQQREEFLKSVNLQKEELLKRVEFNESLTKKQKEEMLQTVNSQKEELLKRVENTESLTKKQAEELENKILSESQEVLQRVHNQRQEFLKTVRSDMQDLKGHTTQKMKQNMNRLKTCLKRKVEQEDVDSLKAEVFAKVETLSRETKKKVDEHNDRLEDHEIKIQANDPTRAYEQIAQLQKNAKYHNSEMENIRADIQVKTKAQEAAVESIRMNMTSQAEDINVINERCSIFEEINQTNQELLNQLTDTVVENTQNLDKLEKAHISHEKMFATSVKRQEMFEKGSLQRHVRLQQQHDMFHHNQQSLQQQNSVFQQQMSMLATHSGSMMKALGHLTEDHKSLKTISVNEILESDFDKWTCEEVCMIFSDPSTPGVSKQLAKYVPYFRRQELDGIFLTDFVQENQWKEEDSIIGLDKQGRMKVKNYLKKFMNSLKNRQQEFSYSSSYMSANANDSGDDSCGQSRKHTWDQLKLPQASPRASSPGVNVYVVQNDRNTYNSRKTTNSVISLDDDDEEFPENRI